MRGRPRLVIDTSTLIGALLRPDSSPRRVFMAGHESHELCLSAATLDELREVLQRPKFDRYVPLPERMEFLELLSARARHWEIDETALRMAAGACRDAKDDKFLALAWHCQAAALVSSDADLLVLNPWNDIPILTPAQFLR